jgi:pimeloyl-ACP methyl ester carboxylesterase
MSRPFFFGESGRQLYGVYHAPRTRGGRDGAVLICPPFGQEYMRTHRALRQLALHLAKRGSHVLRFDYSGTGDSAGQGEDATIETWTQDIGTAIDELKDTSGVQRVSVVGLRLGAALAATALAGRDDIVDLVLWDPVVSGPSYLEELFAMHRDRHGSDPVEAEVIGIEGYPLSSELRRQLRAIDMREMQARGPARLLLVTSERRAEYEQLQNALAGAAVPLNASFVDAPARWRDVDRLGAVLLPRDVIQTVVGMLRGEAA